MKNRLCAALALGCLFATTAFAHDTKDAAPAMSAEQKAMMEAWQKAATPNEKHRQLITEFEGLIDEFTIMDAGRAVLTLNADEARERYQKIRARFAESPPAVEFKDVLRSRRDGRELELIVNGGGAQVLEQLRRFAPELLTNEALTLEEVFVATLK